MNDVTLWPTEVEAAEILETSVRTLARYASSGKLEIRKRPRPGKKPENVCNPRDIEKLKPGPYISRLPKEGSKTSISTGSKPVAIDEMLSRVVELINERLSKSIDFRLGPISPPKLSRVETLAVDKKLYLTLDEASAYSGFARSALRRATKSGDLHARRDGPRGALIIRRAELERFAR